MRPAALKKLISMQNARISEMQLMHRRINEKSRDLLNPGIISSRIEALREIWSEARATHVEIIAADGVETDSYVTDSVFSNLQATYEDTLDNLVTLASTFGNQTAPDRLDEGMQSSMARAVKLPKLDLPSFSGNYEDWESFSDLFTSLVHNVPRVDDSKKLHYLKSCLTGPAADLVKDVATTSANYASTWEALKARFYNPRITVSKHLNALMNLPCLKKESATKMRSFTDECQRIVRALSNLKMPVQHWDIWFVHIISSRLETESRKQWESELSAKDRSPHIGMTSDSAHLLHFPTFAELSAFLEKRAYALTNNKPLYGSRKIFHAGSRPSYKNNTPKCSFCSGFHSITKCSEFMAKTPYARRTDVRHLRLCYNCLGRHKIKECPSSSRCNVCRERHHTLIHFENKASPQIARDKEGNTRDGKAQPSAGISTHTASIGVPEYSVILATAQVKVLGPQGTETRVRALLDQGSEGSFVTEATAQLLGLTKQRVNVPLTVVGGNSAGTARAKTNFVLQSITNASFNINVEALVLSRLTSHLPVRKLMPLDLDQFTGLNLADPQFYVPDTVDLILGADVYSQLLRPGLRRFTTSQLIAQDTALGWIFSGAVENNIAGRAEQKTHKILRTLHSAIAEPLHACLERFWEIEELPQTAPRLTPQEELCEEIYRDTHKRTKDGRYIVRLPRKTSIPTVGPETRRMALGSLNSMHRRFVHDPSLALAYKEFMAVFEKLGHMTRIPEAELNNTGAWYLPHHAVVSANKIRVVFDASRRTREGFCLNDYIMAGPPLQRDLSLTLLNWRRYRFVFTADIVKMFRQIRVAPVDQDLQRIMWAPNPRDAPAEYRLNTVTYGTNCAPYLAIRTLNQLADDERARFPLGAHCLHSETYVDDTFAGADDITIAVRKRIELVEILKTAGITLDKWAANHPELLPPREEQNHLLESKEIDRSDSIKTLCVHWSPAQDQFRFSALKIDNPPESVTKRNILSNIARLFGPLGWLSPITVTAKVIMQDLWINQGGWDDPLPAEMHARWSQYCNSLSDLPTLSIERWLGASAEQLCEIHGFADAFSRAYVAVVYLRIRDNDNNFRVALLAAKTKVAPVKTISIPNLELCGAALLVKLVCHLRKLDFINKLPICLWSDSEIVLKWLNKHPCHWKAFVANRVSHIQTQLPEAKWLHVPSKENPADIATRGATPLDLQTSNLWWHGPAWLKGPLALRTQAHTQTKVLHSRTDLTEPDILTRFSKLTKLIRVVAYCLRPLMNLRRRKDGLKPLPISLSVPEITAARTRIIQISQAISFEKEITLLKAGKPLPKGSPLNNLNPILGKEDRILRVGGRLSHSELPFEQKNPPILSRDSHLSRLFIGYAHLLALHGGPTLTSNILLKYVWIIGRNRLVKSAIRNCVRCQRVKPRLAHQLMGDLPAGRVTPARPFTTSGVDYAGPFQIRTTKGRGHRCYKGYIALFVCFATRAIHLELVSDLSTPTFLAAYRRFVSRRGICRHLFSDNSTTFRGADAELKSMFSAASKFYEEVAAALANDGTIWSFIPPTTPHYGGIWEAGVKSTKHHLKRAFGEHTLTFEEFTTAIAEIEACLNSRPLCPLTSDVEDLRVLTPAHFLIGEASPLIPDEEPPAVPENPLSRFQLLQRIRTQFWRRWSDEYLQQLQERSKWRQPTESFAVGQLVVLRDDRYPPAKWPLGRVLEVHPGPDGHVRVVTVKTSSNTLRRHVARLCPLMINQTSTNAHGTKGS